MKEKILRIIVLLVAIVALIFALSIAKNGKKQNENEKKDINTDTNINNNTRVVNPIKRYETLDEASDVLNFSIVLDESVIEYETKEIKTIQDEILEISYLNDKGNTVVCIRKAKGKIENLDGYYQSFNNDRLVKDVESNKEIHMKGNNEKNKIALWTSNDFSYSVVYDEQVNDEEFLKLIRTIE